MSAALTEAQTWLRRSKSVAERVRDAARRNDVEASVAFPDLRRAVERGERHLRDAEARSDEGAAREAIAAFRDAIARCPRHLTDRASERVSTFRKFTRSSALIDVPREVMPAALRAFTNLRAHARTDAAIARVLPRAQAALERGRQVWAAAERCRDEGRAQEAAAHFDEVVALTPPHLRPEPMSATRSR